MTATGAPPVEKASDLGKGAQGEATRWLAEVELFEEQAKRWWTRWDKIVRRYRNDSASDVPADPGSDTSGRGFAMFWANVETLKPTIYAHDPKADVQRRWKSKDPVARVGAEINERLLDYFIDKPDFVESTRNCRDDYLIVGQGVQWHRYVPHFRTVVPPPATEGTKDQGVQVTNDASGYEEKGEKPEPYEEIDTDAPEPEEIIRDYVYWKDFGWSPGARTWGEVYCVWRKVYLTRDELVARFGREIGDKVNLDYTVPKTENNDKPEKTFFKKATVYEIWDKSSRKVHWLAKSYDGDLLDSRDDPLKITGFFPCQKPVFATQTNGQLQPIPDFLQYQDQAQEMDRLTQRIYTLMDAIRARYLYAANIPELQKLLQDAGELDGTPVDVSILNMVNGDLQKAVWFFPLDMLVKALNELLAARERVKQDAYEISGISDILRGSTDPNETLGAQQLKAQTGGLRVRDRQELFASFVRNGLRIDSDIILNHFQPDTIAKIADIGSIPDSHWIQDQKGQWRDPKEIMAEMQAAQQQAMQQQQQPMPGVPQGIPMMGHNGGPPLQLPQGPTLGEAAVMMLKDPLQRQFKIDIETDSTVEIDQAQEKQARNEFVTAVGSFLQAAEPILAQAPELAPMIGEMLLFAARGFKAGDQLEGVIESSIESLQARLKNPPPPPPDPAMIKAQADAKQTELEGRQSAAEHQQEMQARQVEIQAEQQSRQGEMAAEAQRGQVDQVKAQAEIVKAGIGAQTAQIGLETAKVKAKEAAKPKPKPNA